MAHKDSYDDLSDTGKELVAVVSQAIEEARDRTPAPRQVSTTLPEESSARLRRIVDEKATLTKAELKNEINEKCGACQRPGGAMHDVAKKLDTVIETLAVQRGKREILMVLSPAVMVVVSCLLGAFVNYKFSQLKDMQTQMSLRGTHAVNAPPDPRTAQP